MFQQVERGEGDARCDGTFDAVEREAFEQTSDAFDCVTVSDHLQHSPTVNLHTPPVTPRTYSEILDLLIDLSAIGGEKVRGRADLPRDIQRVGKQLAG